MVFTKDDDDIINTVTWSIKKVTDYDYDAITHVNPYDMTDKAKNFFNPMWWDWYNAFREAQRKYDMIHHPEVIHLLDECDNLLKTWKITITSDYVLFDNWVKIATRKWIDIAIIETFKEWKDALKEEYVYFDGIKRSHYEVKKVVLDDHIEKHWWFEWNEFHLCSEDELSGLVMPQLPWWYGKEKYTSLLYLCPFLFGRHWFVNTDGSARSSLRMRKELIDRKIMHVKKNDYKSSLLLISRQ